jgi:O-antigen/teichoic acid export membrane protein
MSFGRVAAVEAADTVGFNLFALVAAVAGLGVFSLAGAVPVGAILGAGIAWLTPGAVRLPRFELSRVRPLVSFGSRVSVLGMLYLGRDLGYVAIIGAIGGAPMAGFYGMAKRLFSFPTALSAAVARVMLPALSQSGDQRPKRTASMLGQVAIVCGLPLALIAGAIQPFISVVLGPEWLPTSDIVLYGSLSMMLVASLAVPINSFFLAEGKPNAPVLAVSAELAVGFLLVAALVAGLDETGVGIAMSVGTVVSVVILLAATHPLVRAGAHRVARITVITALAAAVGQLLPVPYNTVGLLAALCASAVAWLALGTVLLRGELAQVLGMIRRLGPRVAQ